MNEPTVYKNYFENYTSLVPEQNVLDAFTNQSKALANFLSSVSEEKAIYAYAEGKWSLKEMLQHIIDTERIFAYRALCIARQETATLPGFDENLYADNSAANKRTWADLVHEMKIVRESTLLLFGSFTETMLSHAGNFSSASATPHTIGLIIIGHFYHHVKIANERYLTNA
ncbi:MAG: DinB family protein [Ferruginibacter sp.]